MPAQKNKRNSWLGWYVVLLLLAAYCVSFLDRILISLMVVPIQADLGLSYTKISLLQGLAFAVFYSLMGLPIGVLVDRYNRRNIIALGVFLWSVATALSGLAKSYANLFLARIGVGIGEATLSPAAYSIIGDYFSRRMLARATSIYSMGITFGSGLALLLGGALIDAVSQASQISVPILGQLRPWQMAFLIASLPGLVLVLPLLTIREPARRELHGQEVSRNGRTKEYESLQQVFQFVLSRWRVYGTQFLGFALLTTASYAIVSWVPTYFIQEFGWTPGRIGSVYGLLTLSFGSLGLFCGGYFADRMLHRGRKDAYLRVAMISAICAIPLGVSMPLVPNVTIAAILLAPLSFFLSMPWGIAAAAIVLITPNRLRGQVSAIYLFCINVLGMSLGPFSVAFLTDYIFADEASLGYGLAIASGIALSLAAVTLRAGCSHFVNTVNTLK